MLDAYMQKLVKELGIEMGDVTTNVPGVYGLMMGQGVTINMSELPGEGLYFKCGVAPYPKDNEEMFATQAMLGNMFGQETRGGALGLTLDGKTLTLTRAIDYKVDYKEFNEVLEDFITAVDYWREEALTHK